MELREKNKICENKNQWRIEKKLWNLKQTQDWLTEEKEPDYGRWETGQGQWYHRVCWSEQPLLTSLETQAHLFFKNIFSIHVTFMNSQIVFFSWKGLYSFIHLKSRRRQWRRGGKERERREKESKREGDREGEREGKGGEGKGQGWREEGMKSILHLLVHSPNGHNKQGLASRNPGIQELHQKLPHGW